MSLHRAVAVAEVEGPAVALALVDALDRSDYYLFHAIRADLLRRLGRDAEAVAAYDEALTRTDNSAERRGGGRLGDSVVPVFSPYTIGGPADRQAG